MLSYPQIVRAFPRPFVVVGILCIGGAPCPSVVCLASETTGSSRWRTRTSSGGVLDFDHIGSANCHLMSRGHASVRGWHAGSYRAVEHTPGLPRSAYNKAGTVSQVAREPARHELTPASTLVMSSTWRPAKGRFEALALAASVAIWRARPVWGPHRVHRGDQVRSAPLDIFTALHSIAEAEAKADTQEDVSARRMAVRLSECHSEVRHCRETRPHRSFTTPRPPTPTMFTGLVEAIGSKPQHCTVLSHGTADLASCVRLGGARSDGFWWRRHIADDFGMRGHFGRRAPGRQHQRQW